MKHTTVTTLLLTLLAGLAPTAAQAQVYSWKDAQGRIHYSDLPSADPNAQPVNSVKARRPVDEPSTSSAPAASGAAKTWKEQDLDFRQRKAASSENAAKQQEAEAQKQAQQSRCDSMRRELATIQSGGRIGRSNAKGEIEVYDDAQRKSEGAALQQRINKECS